MCSAPARVRYRVLVYEQGSHVLLLYDPEIVLTILTCVSVKNPACFTALDLCPGGFGAFSCVIGPEAKGKTKKIIMIIIIVIMIMMVMTIKIIRVTLIIK